MSWEGPHDFSICTVENEKTTIGAPTCNERGTNEEVPATNVLRTFKSQNLPGDSTGHIKWSDLMRCRCYHKTLKLVSLFPRKLRTCRLWIDPDGLKSLLCMLFEMRLLNYSVSSSCRFFVPQVVRSFPISPESRTPFVRNFKKFDWFTRENSTNNL